jgi:hypothetical protein
MKSQYQECCNLPVYVSSKLVSFQHVGQQTRPLLAEVTSHPKWDEDHHMHETRGAKVLAPGSERIDQKYLAINASQPTGDVG